ncbi:MAG: hypothetical protein S0880_21435 [Actinomycetota bacterium]|nr:hypothetical protein [Actinomycetota bacterium]
MDDGASRTPPRRRTSTTRRTAAAVMLGVGAIFGPRTDPTAHWSTTVVAEAQAAHVAAEDRASLPGRGEGDGDAEDAVGRRADTPRTRRRRRGPVLRRIRRILGRRHTR